MPCRVFFGGLFSGVESVLSIDEKFNAALAILVAKTRVIGRTFVAELVYTGQCFVGSEVLFVAERRF
jgi:hypothetical protein